MMPASEAPSDPSPAASDIEGLARFVPGIDPRRYFDGQQRDAYLAAVRRWPLAAGAMGLSESGPGPEWAPPRPGGTRR